MFLYRTKFNKTLSIIVILGLILIVWSANALSQPNPPETPWLKGGPVDREDRPDRDMERGHRREFMRERMMENLSEQDQTCASIAEAKFEIANIYAEQGQNEQALETLRGILNLPWEDKHEFFEHRVFMRMAEISAEANDFKKAQEIIQEAMNRFEDKRFIAHLHTSLGRIYQKQGRVKEALEEYQKAIAEGEKLLKEKAPATP